MEDKDRVLHHIVTARMNILDIIEAGVDRSVSIDSLERVLTDIDEIILSLEEKKEIS